MENKKYSSPEEAEFDLISEMYPGARLSEEKDAEGKYLRIILAGIAIIFSGFMLFLSFFFTDVSIKPAARKIYVEAEVTKISVFRPVFASQVNTVQFAVNYDCFVNGKTVSGRVYLDEKEAKKQYITLKDMDVPYINIKIYERGRTFFDLDGIHIFVFILFCTCIFIGIMFIFLAKKTKAEYAAGKYVIYENRGKMICKKLGHI